MPRDEPVTTATLPASRLCADPFTCDLSPARWCTPASRRMAWSPDRARCERAAGHASGHPRTGRSSSNHQRFRARQHRVDHLRRELPRVRVLLAHVIAAEQHGPAGDLRFRSVAELRSGPGHPQSPPDEVGERRSPPDAAERQYHAHVPQGRDLTVEPAAASRQLVGQRLVLRGCAAAGRRDERPRQAEPVALPDARRLVRESGAVQGGVEEVAAPVAGEHAPGPVSPVRRRRKAHDEERRARVAEPRQRTGPIGPLAEALDLRPGHFLAPRHQPRAGPALDDLAMQGFQPGQEPRVPPRPPPRWLPRGMFWAGPRIPNPRWPPCASLPCGVPRKPPAPPKRPPPCPFSSASFTLSGLPPKSFPFSSAMAAFASSSLSRSTKANPRDRPVSLSVMIFTVLTVRLSPAISCLTCASVVSKGRLPTNRRAMGRSFPVAGGSYSRTSRRAPEPRLWHLGGYAGGGATSWRDQALRQLYRPRPRRSGHSLRRGLCPAGPQRRGEDHSDQPGGGHRAPYRGHRGGARPRRRPRLPLHPPRRRAGAAGDQLRPVLHRRGDAAVPGRLLRRGTRRRPHRRDPGKPRPARQAARQHPRTVRRNEAAPADRQGAGARSAGALSR